MLFSNTELPKILVSYKKFWFTGIAANITSKKIILTLEVTVLMIQSKHNGIHQAVK